MRIHHVGLSCRREADADRFFVELLGLEKSEPMTTPVALARPIFGIDRDIEKRNYAGDGVLFELFFHDDPLATTDRIAHACLEVALPDALAERARAMGFAVLRVPKGDGFVVFVEDADGHRFEIKKG